MSFPSVIEGSHKYKYTLNFGKVIPKMLYDYPSSRRKCVSWFNRTIMIDFGIGICCLDCIDDAS